MAAFKNSNAVIDRKFVCYQECEYVLLIVIFAPSWSWDNRSMTHGCQDSKANKGSLHGFVWANRRRCHSDYSVISADFAN